MVLLVQKTQTGRKTTGISEFHDWRVLLGLTQLAAAELLGVTATTAQRWDAHPGAAPATLADAMAHHTVMRAEVARIRGSWLDSDFERAQFVETEGASLEATIEGLGVTHQLAVDYGLAHHLFG